MDKLHKGAAETRDFYNRVGWRPQDGLLVDTRMFASGWTEGPIHRALDDQRKERVRHLAGGPALKLVELGWGGSPAMFLVERCATYTAVDFSLTGLTEAAAKLKNANVPFQTIEADITDLPLKMVRSIWLTQRKPSTTLIQPTVRQAPSGRRCASLGQVARAIFVLANPFPLLFPYRLVRRVLAMAPGLNTVLNRVRAKTPLPYLPMPLGWMKRQLAKWGNVKITGHAVPSFEFARRVSETTVIGRPI